MAEVNMEELLNCALCPNICRSECPVVQVRGREAVAPAGKARLAAMLHENHLEWDEGVMKAVSNCLGCRGCTIHCPFTELSLCDELRLTRLSAKESGVYLPESTPYLNNLRSYGSPYGRSKVRDTTGSSGARVLFFCGCTSPANHPESIDAAISLFKKAGVDFQIIDEDCCGFPAEVWGDADLARQLAAENRRKFIDSGAETVVTNCPECWLMFSQRYPEWDLQLPQKIVDGPTYLLSLLKEGRLNPGETSLEKISYHDPCIWARTAKKSAEAREILQSVPGLKLTEPYSHSELTRCCGGGNMFQLTFPPVAAAIAKGRLKEFPAGNAIVTACPFCREGLIQEGQQVIELVELLAEACK